MVVDGLYQEQLRLPNLIDHTFSVFNLYRVFLHLINGSYLKFHPTMRNTIQNKLLGRDQETQFLIKTEGTYEEVAGLVLGFDPWDLGLQLHQVAVEPLLEKIGIPYNPKTKYLGLDGKEIMKPGLPSVLKCC